MNLVLNEAEVLPMANFPAVGSGSPRMRSFQLAHTEYKSSVGWWMKGTYGVRFMVGWGWDLVFRGLT